jgi:hypothetical protein
MTASKHTKAAEYHIAVRLGNLVPAPDYYYYFFTVREQVSLYANHQNVSKGRI